MELQIVNIVFLLALVALLIVLIWLSINTASVKRRVTELPDLLQTDLQNTLQSQHRAMLTDLADSLAKQGERISTGQIDSAQRLSAVVSGELEKTRLSLQTLQVEQSQNLNANREALIHQLSQLTLDLAKRQEALKTEVLGGTLEKLAEQRDRKSVV